EQAEGIRVHEVPETFEAVRPAEADRAGQAAAVPIERDDERLFDAGREVRGGAVGLMVLDTMELGAPSPASQLPRELAAVVIVVVDSTHAPRRVLGGVAPAAAARATFTLLLDDVVDVSAQDVARLAMPRVERIGDGIDVARSEVGDPEHFPHGERRKSGPHL